MTDCFFQCNLQTPTSSVGPERIKTILECSKRREDGLHDVLQTKLESETNATINCHRACVSTYTSSWHINVHLKRKSKTSHKDPSPSVPPAKRCRRSEADFDFKLHCIFCGEQCSTSPSRKNPKRWRAAFLCKPPENGKYFKESVLDCCNKRNDEWANQVRLRVAGAMSDLYAVSARYHDNCRKKFMNSRNVTAASKLAKGV